MVLPRVLTALIAIPVVLTVVWYGSLAYFLFILGICLLAFWEYSLMAESGGYPNQLGLGLFGTVVVLLALYRDGAPWGPIASSPSPIFIFMLWFFLVFLREFVRADKSYSFLRIITTLAGVVICGLALGHLLIIRELKMVVGEGWQAMGREVIFFFFFVVWAVDIGAWAVGRMIGRRPLAPRISPKKSWEGAIGGTLIACGVAWFCREAFMANAFGRMEAVFYGFIIAVTAQFSDLFESLLKRSFGAKDSSALLPGHGGILDRFDSFVFAAPLFFHVLIGTGRFY